MQLHAGKRRSFRQGFSLVELSIVVAIMSVVTVAGLEVATQYVGSRAYDQTQAQLATLDTALDQFYKVNGRLPCPAARGLTMLDGSTNYGKEDCTVTDNTGVLFGTVPFRTLGLSQSAGTDAWGDKINYYVSDVLTNMSGSDTATNGSARIIVRSGNFTTWTALADTLTTPNTGAAYVLISNGADKRGAVSKNGVAAQPCGTNDTRIDTQNCAVVAGGTTSPSISANIVYDSRYNNGSVSANYFDDVVVWRERGQL